MAGNKTIEIPKQGPDSRRANLIMDGFLECLIADADGAAWCLS